MDKHKDDNDNTYTILIQETHKWLVTYDNPGEWVSLGNKKTITSDGRPVVQIDDNTYEIVDFPKNIIVRK